MTFAAACAFALFAAASAHAQSAHLYSGSSVTIDYSVLDHLGPAPNVRDGRIVLHAPARRAPVRAVFRHAHRHIHHLTKRIVHRRTLWTQIVRDGSVTIDYAALPPRVETSGPRIVLRRPHTAVAAEKPVKLPETRLAQARPAVRQVAVRTPPAPKPAPPETWHPWDALLPAGTERHAAPRSDLSELSSLLPFGGVALAATRSPTAPLDRNVPRSDSRAIRFIPGSANLRGDAQAILKALAQKLNGAPNERIELIAYASAGDEADAGRVVQAIEARRISLARAVMVRAYLIQHGVDSTRIDVRALGNRVTDGGTADRVDLVTIGR